MSNERRIAARQIARLLEEAGALAQEHGFDIEVRQVLMPPLAMGRHATMFNLFNSRKVYSVQARWLPVPILDNHLCSNCRWPSAEPYESCPECGATMEKPNGLP